MSTLTDPRTFGPHRRSSIMESSRRSIFGSFKSSLSRGKQTSSSNSQQQAQQQAKYVAQPTRRPAAAPSSNPFHSASSFDAPPAYSEATSAAPQLAPISHQTAPGDDDEYAFLDTFDTVFLIDDSGSMAGGLWRQTAEALMTIAPICTAHDKDGIDIYFLNNSAVYKNVRSSAKVQQIFETVRPGGSTPTGQRLESILVKNYLKDYETKPDTTKPINLICITDGAPTDDDEGPLISTAETLDDLRAPAWQVGIQFFQVGSDPKAAKHLKVLDDDLAKFSTRDRMRDIVDTVPFTDANGGRLSADGILKVVLGAVTRRLDRNSEDLHR